MIERRKTQCPERPLIRISSTFFWHLSSDFDLTPISSLQDRAKAVRADALNLGKVEEEDSVYEPMKVGHQVQKYVSVSMAFAPLHIWSIIDDVGSELKHIALMA